MLTLDPMNDEEFHEFFAWNEEEHAKERMISDYLTFEDALAKVKALRSKLIAGGRSSPNHYFFKLLADSPHRQVGSVWFHIRPESQDVFLYNIEIFTKERRKGYGRQALASIEKFSKAKGATIMWLNVFGHNAGARQLYSSVGYKEAAIHMNKLL